MMNVFSENEQKKNKQTNKQTKTKQNKTKTNIRKKVPDTGIGVLDNTRPLFVFQYC